MYQLYYSPGACSLAVHVLLNELGVDYELKNASIPEGKNKEAAFLQINPRGQVPVLVDNSLPPGQQVIREGAAMMIHLMEKHASGFLPKNGVGRVQALEWLMYGNASLHPAYSRLFFLKKNGMKPEDPLFRAAEEAVNRMWKEIDSQLAETPYLCGEQLTMADILISVIANWSGAFDITLGSNVKRLLKEVIARPAYQKALQSEKVEYKAAA